MINNDWTTLEKDKFKKQYADDWTTVTTEIKTDVIDNFISDDEFKKIQERFMGSAIEWFYNPDDPNLIGKTDTGFSMVHVIFCYPQGICSHIYNDIMPVIQKLAATSLIRIRANLYPNQGKLKQHEPHADFLYPHQGALFSINTCDGYTLLEDGSKVESVANRMVFFDTSKSHASTSPSTTKTRINIQFNYHAFLKE